MKTLAFQQPWAILVASGVKTIENRTWNTPYRGKVLIVASSKKIPRTFYDELPLEWYNAFYTEQLFGNVPENENMTYSAIIGYADLVEITQGVTDNVWDGRDPEGYKWRFENAYLFDKPITGVKGKLHLYDTPEIDENNLPPAHKVEIKHPHMEGKTLVIPICEALKDQADQITHFHFPFDETASYANALLKDPDECESDEYEFVEMEEVRFECGDKSATHKIKSASVTSPVNQNNEFIKVYSLDKQDYIEPLDFSFELE